MTKILFLLKKNSEYSSYVGARTGLYNSARILARELSANIKIRTKVALCVDGNSIDKEVHDYRPDICILEAIWVTPTKLEELIKIHPKVRFIVRVHSETPFLANEGIAFDWINGYTALDVTVGVNSKETLKELIDLYPSIVYLPNVYEEIDLSKVKFFKYLENRIQYFFDPRGWTKLTWHVLNVGCFGAIRPMKNQLFQAVAAIRYANKAGTTLRFHINAGRTEQNGQAVLKNLRALFENTKHELVEHPWLNREDFLAAVKKMDVGLQVSFTESFNIVAADFVKQGVPMVVSPAVRWCPEFSKTSTLESDGLVKKIGQALRYHRMFERGQKIALQTYNFKSLASWYSFLHDCK